MQHSSTILVVDDDQDIRFFLQEALEDAAYDVATVANGAEALAHLQHNPVDLILLDLWMPESNGVTFLQRFYEQPGPHVPVVLMTAGKLDEPADPITKSAAILKKPFELNDLYLCIEQVLKGAERTANI